MPDARHEPLTPSRLHQGTRYLAQRDAALAGIVDRLGMPPLWAREPGFATLVQIILEQQVSLKSARTLYQRIDATLGGVSPDTVTATGEAGLRALGMTRQKARYCHELAIRVTGGQLRLDTLTTLTDEEGRRALLAVPGLGPWSVDVYYLMALRRPDAWPYGDLALAAAIGDVKALDAPATRDQQARFAEAWSPWRGVAARLLWLHYLDAQGQLDAQG